MWNPKKETNKILNRCKDRPVCLFLCCCICCFSRCFSCCSALNGYNQSFITYKILFSISFIFPKSKKDSGVRRALRNRVVSASAPWMAAEQSAGSKVETFERAMLPECLQSILGACRRKAAGWRFERRDADLIETYQENEGADGYLLDDSQEFMLLLLHFC